MFDAGGMSSVLKLDTDPYAAGMLKAQSIAATFPQTVTTYLTNPLLGLVGTFTSAATAAIAFFKEATDEDDKLSDLSASVGVAVSDLDALGKAAIFAGSNAEGVADSYRFLGKSVSEAMENADGDASKTFRRLGVEFLSAQGTARPLQEIMLDLADAFKALPEGGARTSAAMGLLGRGGASLVPLLVQGKQAVIDQMNQMRAYGAVVGATANESAGKWNDAMDEMAIAWGGLKRSLAEPIRNALLPHLETLLDWTRKHQPEIRKSLDDLNKSLIARFDQMGKVIDWMADHWRQFAAIAAGVAAYMAGPAVLGAILTIGPAIMSIVAPLGALRLGITGVMLAINPLAGFTRIFSIALGVLAATLVMQPGVLKGFQTALQYVGAVGAYVGDVFSKVVAPAIGRVASEAFARLQPYLPTTADLWNLLGRALDSFERGLNRTINFVVDRVIPAFGRGLRVAMDWIEPKLAIVGQAFLAMLDDMSAVANWIIGPGVNAVVDVFSAAWDYLGMAVAAVRPYFDATLAGMQAVVAWIVDVAAPAVGGFFVNAWSSLFPVLQGVGTLLATIYTSVIGPFIGWIISTAVPAIGEYFVMAWNTLAPAAYGIGRTFLGVWDVMRGLFGFALPLINVTTVAVQALAGVISWGWTSILQPMIGWLWSVGKPIAEFFGNMVGWIFDKLGQVLSWLGSVIGKAAEATAAITKVPSSDNTAKGMAVDAARDAVYGRGGTGSTPTPPVPVYQPTPLQTPPVMAAEQPGIPVFNFRQNFTDAASAAKQAGAEAGKAAVNEIGHGFDAMKGFKMPELQMPELRIPTPPDFGEAFGNAGVQSLQDRFDAIKHGTNDVLDEHEAAIKQQSVDLVKARREIAATQKAYNDQIRDALHRHASVKEVDALRDAKETAIRALQPKPATPTPVVPAAAKAPTINVHAPAIDTNKLATLVAQKVTDENNKQLDRAIAAGRQARHQANVAGGL